MINPREFALNLINNNPQVMNNPIAKQYIDVIQNGNSEQIKSLAMNICNSYGVTPEEAAGQAINFFGIRQ